MKNHREKHRIAYLLAVAIIFVLSTASGSLKANAAETAITRIEWLHDLTELFNMTVEEDNYPDNYFSDIAAEDEYYRDVMVATEFGLVDVEEGYDMRPDDPVTREFASYTMNICLGYVLEETDVYTFSDKDTFTYFEEETADSYYQAAQIAINRKWMELKEGKFQPQEKLTQAEKDAMWSDAQSRIQSEIIDDTYENTVTFADGVIEVPKETKYLFEEYEDGNFVTLFNYTGALSEGDTFALWVNGLPALYEAIAVEDMGSGLVVQIREADDEEAIEELDAQGTVEADLATAVQEGEGSMTWIAGGSPEEQYEDGREVRSPRLAGSVPITAIKRSIPFKLADGFSVTLNITIPKPTVNYKIDGTQDIYVALDADTTVSVVVKGDMVEHLGLPTSIDVVYIPIGGIGAAKVSVAVAASGQCSVNYEFNAVAGIHYTKGNGTSLVSSFKKKSFTIAAEAELSATLTATLGVTSIPKVDANIWAKIGPRMGLKAWTYGDDKKPALCMDTYGYVYASAGATLKILSKDYSPRAHEFWTKQSSPLRVAAHYEDGVRTSGCTRDAGERRYYTRDSSKYFSDGSGIYNSAGSSGSGTVIQPRYEYSLSENDAGEDVATITKYYGSVAAVVIPNTIDGYPVVAIGSSAFKGNTYLRTVLIPDCVTSIGRYAFSSCTQLSDVILSKNLVSMGIQAFEACNALTTIEIPKSLNEISTLGTAGGAFYKCMGLKNVIFEEGTSKIVNNLFAWCYGLESIEIPDTVTCIESKAFAECTGLKNIDFGNAVTSISAYAFEGCPALESVIIPDTVTSIGFSAFANCINLSNVTLSKNLVTLGGKAFEACNALTAIEIPKSLKEISTLGTAGGAFYKCTGLKNVTFEEGTSKIVNNLFEWCYGLESIEIPDTVTSIERQAFAECTGLKDIDLGDAVTSIDSYAFLGCIALKSVIIPDTVTSISNFAFERCTALETIIIPDSVTSMGISVFRNCSNLKSVQWNSVLQQIPDNMFRECVSLVAFECPPVVTSIGEAAFYNCDALEKVTIPDSVIKLGASVFYDCDALTTVTLGTGLITIPNSTFEHCDLLESIVLPYRIQSIGSKAFKDCVKFTSITIPRQTTAIDTTAFSYPAKMTVYGISGTYAETFANAQGMTFVNREVKATEASLSETQITINKGSKATLVLAVTPSDFTDEVSWKCTDTNVVTIDDSGLVTAKNVGEAVIKVIVGDLSVNCKVTVVQPVTSISLNKSALTLEALDTYQLTARVHPSNAENQEVVWSTSDERVASVTQDGLVKALGKGTATITVAAQDGSGVSGKCTVTVSNTAHEAASVEELESPHNYVNNCSDFWVYSVEEAINLDVSFDNNTNVEEDFDFLYIYDGEGNQVGKYTGTELAGETVRVPGNQVRIKLVSDDAGTAWGFKVTDVRAITEIEKQEQVIVGTEEYQKETGDAPFKLDAVLKTGDGELGFVSDNPAVAKVSADGTVTVTGAGTAVITVTAAETELYKEASFQVTIVVSEKATDNPSIDKPPVDNPPVENPPTDKPPVNSPAPKAVGTVLTVQGSSFRVTKTQGASPTVAFCSVIDKNETSVIVPKTIQSNGITYQVTSVDKNAFANLKKLKTVVISAGVTEIGANAFKSCVKLTKVTLPSSLQTIGTGAFNKCTSLKKIVIGKSVSKIGAKAFYGCKTLKTITIKSTKLKSVGKSAIGGIHKKAVIKVPKKQLKAYKKLFKKSTGYKSSMKVK